MTVHGEREKLPAVTKADATKALSRFADGFNKIRRTLDPSLSPKYEAGAMLALDQAKVKAAHGLHPQGSPNVQPVTFQDAHFAIPKQTGWPRSFLADVRTNIKFGSGDYIRWYLVFGRDSIDAPWRVTYQATFPNNQAPELALDHGFAEAVPAGGASGLAADPGTLSASYADYLNSGKGEVFASGANTDGWRQKRIKDANGVGARILYEDSPAGFPPVALRTKDGGALVFFATYYHQQKTVSSGMIITVGPDLRGILQGPMKKKTTQMAISNISTQAVKVPPKSAGGKVEFLYRVDAKTALKAQ
ncbi:hypothetical protein [Streptomyces gilvosporeus]|uniref:DUF8094 domain-containing protein n=1 Tax=Streptomyces gilvosporeus TaxID=553510 RepID=A0A1V0TQ35_9ACTN|nr:hypothetical protein [Streptomyces gilvosporeus]ARF55045.1 hypothetical protein B1H19_13250 [Streptomyces gilvosporeus]